MDVGAHDRRRHPAEDGDERDADYHDRDEDLDQRVAAFPPAETSDGKRHCPMFTWRKMPYMADTSAIATKPTMTPMKTMMAGSKRLVKRLIL